jgi:ABC-type transporter Mla MlaB component
MPSRAAARMAAVHADAVYDDGVLTITLAGSPPVIAIAGDIDECTYAGLMTTLDKFASRDGEVRISLAAVRHCDLAGLRAIVRLAGTGSDGWDSGDRRVVLLEVPQNLTAILAITGWDTTPGLALG